ncbi:MAG: hypothetical protein ACYS7Y_34070 [Planctomycetota bacterium]|jgi:hypothetical protein
MKNKAFVIVAVVLFGSWLVTQLKQNDLRHKIVMTRHEQMSLMRTRIDDLKESMTSRADETVSNGHLNKAMEIGRLESQIGNLRIENSIAESEDGMYWRIMMIIVLVLVFTQSGVSDKKTNIRKAVA